MESDEYAPLATFIRMLETEVHVDARREVPPILPVAEASNTLYEAPSRVIVEDPDAGAFV